MKFYRPVFCWESRDVLLARAAARNRRQRILCAALAVLLLGLVWYLTWCG